MLSVTNDGLVGYRRTGGPVGNTLVPDLAQALPAPADGGRTYTFHLRPGIRYSTGAPVRPEDFRRAIERDFRLSYLGGGAGLYSGIPGAGQCVRAPGHCDLARGIITSDQRTRHLPPHRAGPGVPVQARVPLRRRRPRRNAGPPDRPGQLPRPART